jgi:hypothetical protein
VISWFEAFAFEWVNVCRYAAATAEDAAAAAAAAAALIPKREPLAPGELLTVATVGLCRLNQVDP